MDSGDIFFKYIPRSSNASFLLGMRPGIYTYGRAQSISAALEMAAPEVSLPGHGAIGRSSNRNQFIYIYISLGGTRAAQSSVPTMSGCITAGNTTSDIYIYIYTAPRMSGAMDNGVRKSRLRNAQVSLVSRWSLVPVYVFQIVLLQCPKRR